jgi:hypothetical protein
MKNEIYLFSCCDLVRRVSIQGFISFFTVVLTPQIRYRVRLVDSTNMEFLEISDRVNHFLLLLVKL